MRRETEGKRNVSISLTLTALIVSISFPLFSQTMDPGGAPPIGGFTQGADNLEQFTNSVNLLTGDLNFPFQLVTMPQKAGIGIDVSLTYSSAVENEVVTWNLEAPTSVVGLGWRLNSSRIVVDNKATGTREDDEYYFAENDGMIKLVCVGTEGDDKLYQTKQFRNWLIRYNALSERWTITRENGIRFVYGDNNSFRNTIDWGVKWGNWVGSSIQPSGQQRHPVQWNLSEIVNTWEHRILYWYTAVERAVGSGGLTHTEASYLSAIRDSWGNEVQFVMNEKNQLEFMEPHIEAMEPDAYQERYETKYLEKIRIIVNEQLQSETRFSYRTDLIGTGDKTKRVLESIYSVMVTGETAKVADFEYLTTGSSKGKLKKIKSALGGHVLYEYRGDETPATVNLSNRRMTINSPGPTFQEPRVWFANDYVVVTWRELASGGGHGTGSTRRSLKVRVYSWEGEWKTEDGLIDIPSVEMTSDGYQNYRIATGQDFFGIIKPSYLQANYYTLRLYHKDERRSGKWLEETRDIDLGSHTGSEVELFAGDNYVAVSNENGKILAYTWNGSIWIQTIFQESADEHSTAFGHNFILSHNDEANNDDFTFYVLNQQKVWTTVQQSVSYNNSGGNAVWKPSSAFAFTFKAGGDEHIFSWNENYILHPPYSVGSSIDHGSFTYITNSTISTLEPGGSRTIRSFRYNGNSWVPSGAITSSGAKFADDLMLYYLGGNDNRLRTYNPNLGYWLPAATVAGAGSARYLGNNSLFFATTVGRRDRSGTWNYSTRSERPEVDMATDRFYLSHFTDWTPGTGGHYYESTFLRNNAYLYSGQGGTADQYMVYSPNFKLVSQNTYVTTYSFAQFNNATSLILHRVVNNNSWFQQTDLPVERLTLDDGNGNIRQTSILYDLSTATCDPTGTITLYNKVTVVPGSASATIRPFGYIEYFFHNGVSSASLLEPVPANIEKLGKGQVYRKKIFDAENRLLTSSKTTYAAFSKPLSDAGGVVKDVAYAVLPTAVTTMVDGVESYTEYSYHPNSLQIIGQTSRNISNVAAMFPSQAVTQETMYAWQNYPAMKATNQLTAVCQTKKRTEDVTTEISVTRYKSWQSRYAAYDSYVRSTIYAGDPMWDFGFYEYWDPATKPSTIWRPAGSVVRRDELAGTPIEMTGDGNELVSLILDASGTKIFAKVLNASQTDIGYSSFEDTSTGNFSILDGTSISGKGRTGVNYHQLGQAGISKNTLNPASQYTVSFWAISTMGNVSLDGVGSVSIDSPVWKFYEFEISGRSSILLKRVGEASVWIDELRIYPSNAWMTTFTYHPAFGTASVTDQNNQTRYTEYDAFGRVIAIRNDDEDLIEVNKYHVKD